MDGRGAGKTVGLKILGDAVGRRADAPFNMHWQERRESLVKDRLERAVCRAMRQ